MPLAMRHFSALVLMLSVLLPAAARAVEPPAGPGIPGEELHVTDDLGQPIRAAIEVCAISGLERACSSRQGSAESFRVRPFDSVSIEGPEHGPVTARRADLSRGDDGVWRLTVPRKTLLELRGLPPGPVTLSLYKQDDRDFRRPAVRVPAVARELRIPAGKAVLSLAAAGKAPDLHLISAPPGGRIAVEYRPRPGWSLLVRALDEATARPVDRVLVEVTAAAGYGDAAAPPASARTDELGLVVLCGLAPQIANVSLARPGYVERHVPGLSATPGSFSFREVRLERPGSLAAAIRLAGEPAIGALCRIQAPTPGNASGSPRQAPAVLFDGRADRQGVCRATSLPRGEYLLRITPPGKEERPAAARLEPVLIDPGRETAVELELRPLPVEGMVRRGADPAPGYRVEMRSEGPSGVLEEAGTVKTAEDGKYEAILWAEGEYSFVLFDATGGLADMKRVWVGGDGATCDFRLASHRLEGIVTDREGHPVGGASVLVGLKREPTGAQAATDDGGTFRGWNVRVDEQGHFSFLLEDVAGRLTITASKEGFRPSAAVEMAVDGETEVPRVSLVLERGDDLAGVLVSAGGAPVPGAWVAAFDLAGETAVNLGSAETRADGSFALPRSRGGSTLLFASGPGCPLRGWSVGSTGPAGSRPLTLTCAPAPATLELTLVDGEGHPLPRRGIALRRGAEVLPGPVVASHLARFGLPAASDGAGRLVVPALTPGEYEVYLADASNPATIAAGLPAGHLATASLAPLATAEVEVTVETE